MSFSYSGDPSKSAKDRVRWELGDTLASSAKLSDEEITFAIENENTINAAIARCARVVATQFRQQVNVKVGPLSYDYQKRAENWEAVAASFDEASAGADIAVPGGPRTDPTKPYDPAKGAYFRTGMHDRNG